MARKKKKGKKEQICISNDLLELILRWKTGFDAEGHPAKQCLRQSPQLGAWADLSELMCPSGWAGEQVLEGLRSRTGPQLRKQMDPSEWGQWRRQEERREALVPDLQSLIVLRSVRH